MTQLAIWQAINDEGDVDMSRNQFPPTVRGYEFGEVASALQKACRRCSVDDALYWALELDWSGYTDYVWRRLFVICSEDVGPAEPGLPAELNGLYTSCMELKRKKSAHVLPLVHAVMLTAKAKKSRIVCNALVVHHEMIRAGKRDREIPDVALDKHTLAGKKKGRGYEHFYKEGALVADPATGELGVAPNMEDPYAEQAEQLECKQVTRIVKR